jgi:hypothetical protein
MSLNKLCPYQIKQMTAIVAYVQLLLFNNSYLMQLISADARKIIINSVNAALFLGNILYVI